MLILKTLKIAFRDRLCNPLLYIFPISRSSVFFPSFLQTLYFIGSSPKNRPKKYTFCGKKDVICGRKDVKSGSNPVTFCNFVKFRNSSRKLASDLCLSKKYFTFLNAVWHYILWVHRKQEFPQKNEVRSFQRLCYQWELYFWK